MGEFNDFLLEQANLQEVRGIYTTPGEDVWDEDIRAMEAESQDLEGSISIPIYFDSKKHYHNFTRQVKGIHIEPLEKDPESGKLVCQVWWWQEN